MVVAAAAASADAVKTAVYNTTSPSTHQQPPRGGDTAAFLPLTTMLPTPMSLEEEGEPEGNHARPSTTPTPASVDGNSESDSGSLLGSLSTSARKSPA